MLLLLMLSQLFCVPYCNILLCSLLHPILVQQCCSILLREWRGDTNRHVMAYLARTPAVSDRKTEAGSTQRTAREMAVRVDVSVGGGDRQQAHFGREGVERIRWQGVNRKEIEKVRRRRGWRRFLEGIPGRGKEELGALEKNWERRRGIG